MSMPSAKSLLRDIEDGVNPANLSRHDIKMLGTKGIGFDKKKDKLFKEEDTEPTTSIHRRVIKALPTKNKLK